MNAPSRQPGAVATVFFLVWCWIAVLLLAGVTVPLVLAQLGVLL
jgi:hypothetical protein